jgi:phosphoserine aminotransferase
MGPRFTGWNGDRPRYPEAGVEKPPASYRDHRGALSARDMLALPAAGMSILEISHRSAPFEAVLAQAEADIRTLGGVPSNYKVLFLQGGASTQFSMVLSAAQMCSESVRRS